MYDLSFKLEAEDIEKGYLTRKRYWELVKAGVASRGHKITDITEVGGAFYLLTTDDGWILYHPLIAERLRLPPAIIKRYKSGEVAYGY